jgi:hypothetical protein
MTKSPEKKALFSFLPNALREHGAPLVRTRDNGAAFHRDELERILSPYGVAVLYSAADTPRWNDSVKAGVGVRKGGTEAQAW